MVTTMTNTPPSHPGKQTPLVLAIGSLLALLWTGGTVLAPWLAAHDSVLGGWLRLLYRPGCHQISDRCLDLGFGPLAVCARCMGLYVGGCLGLIGTTVFNRSFRPRPIWFLIVAIPTIIDFISGKVGLPSFGNWLRFSVAVPLGLAIGLLKAKLIFVKACRKNLDRIAALERPRIWLCYRPLFLVFLAAMILTAKVLTDLTEGDYAGTLGVAVLDFTIGAGADSFTWFRSSSSVGVASDATTTASTSKGTWSIQPLSRA